MKPPSDDAPPPFCLPVTPYDRVRDHLRTGDIVFCAGRYLFSRLISWATGSPITHTALVIRVDELDRILVLEAVESFGVRLAPLASLLTYHGAVFVARGTVGDITQAAAWGLDQLAQPYSYATIVALAWRIALRRARGTDPDQRGFVCSEFVSRWLALAGEADLFPEGRESLLTPDDLWRHNSLSLVARIR